MSSSTNKPNSSNKILDPSRLRGGVDAALLYINLDALITLSTRPPAPPENFIDRKNDIFGSHLRRLGMPQTIQIQNPLANQHRQNNNNLDENNNNTNVVDGAATDDATSCFTSHNANTLYVRTRPFANLFHQIVTARITTFVFSSLPQRLMEEILDRLQWNKYLRCGGVQFPSGSNNSNNNENNNLGEAFSTSSGYLTLPQVGLHPHTNAHARVLILDVSKSHWHPLLRSQIITAPRQNLSKSLPRYLEPLGLLISMNTIFDVVNLYEASPSSSSANEINNSCSISQCLTEITVSRFDSWKVFVPPSLSAPAVSSSSSTRGNNNNNNTKTTISNTSASSAANNEDAAVATHSAVDFTFLSDNVRMITTSGGGKIISHHQLHNNNNNNNSNSTPNLWLYVGEVANPHLLSSTSSSSETGNGDQHNNKNSNNNNLLVPEPSMLSHLDLVRPAYFEACQALQIALPPVLFSVPHSEAVIGHSANKANTKLLNISGDTVIVQKYKSQEARFQEEVDRQNRAQQQQQQQGGSNTNNNFAFDSAGEKHKESDQSKKHIHGNSCSHNNSFAPTSGTMNVDLSSWWEWMSSPAPFPFENLHSILCSASVSSDEITKELQRIEKMSSSTTTTLPQQQQQQSRTLFNHQHLQLLNPQDWVASEFSAIPQKLKEETYFVVTWLLARCFAPFSKALHWLPFRTLRTCLDQAQVDISQELFYKVFDSTNIQLFANNNNNNNYSGMSVNQDSAASLSKPSEIRAKLMAAHNVKPGCTFFVVSADGQYLARASSSGVIEMKYLSQNQITGDNGIIEGKPNSRTSIRFDQNYFKDCSTATDGDDRVKLPTNPEIAIQTETQNPLESKVSRQSQTELSGNVGVVAGNGNFNNMTMNNINNNSGIPNVIISSSLPRMPSISLPSQTSSTTTLESQYSENDFFSVVAAESTNINNDLMVTQNLRRQRDAEMQTQTVPLKTATTIVGGAAGVPPMMAAVPGVSGGRFRMTDATSMLNSTDDNEFHEKIPGPLIPTNTAQHQAATNQKHPFQQQQVLAAPSPRDLNWLHKQFSIPESVLRSPAERQGLMTFANVTLRNLGQHNDADLLLNVLEYFHRQNNNNTQNILVTAAPVPVVQQQTGKMSFPPPMQMQQQQQMFQANPAMVQQQFANNVFMSAQNQVQQQQGKMNKKVPASTTKPDKKMLPVDEEQ